MQKLKRVTFWVDCKDEKVETVHSEIAKFFKSQGLTYTVVEVSELVSAETCSK